MNQTDTVQLPYAAPQELIDGLLKTDRLIVAGHVTPDADCLGSMMGAARVLRAAGICDVSIAVPNAEVSRRLKFMLDTAGLPVVTGEIGPEADTALIVDTAKPSRVNVPGKWDGIQADGRNILNLDHHASNEQFGDISWVVATASSSAEIVFWLLRQMNLTIDATSASLLYAGIWGDTSGFSLPTSNGPALQAAAGLVDAGADVEFVGQHLCRSLDESEFKLLRVVYDNTKLTAGNRIAYSTIDHDELVATGCMAADIDDQVGVPRMLSGIQIALLFSEGHKGKIRINFRGECGMDVLPLAQKLGGGGHRQAAGSIMSGTVAEVAARVIAESEAYLNEQTSGD